MMTVVPLREGDIVPAVVMEPDIELIAKLEEWVEMAKSGHLRAMGYVMIDRDRAIRTRWIGHGDHHDMTAGVNILTFRYMQAARDEDD